MDCLTLARSRHRDDPREPPTFSWKVLQGSGRCYSLALHMFSSQKISHSCGVHDITVMYSDVTRTHAQSNIFSICTLGLYSGSTKKNAYTRAPVLCHASGKDKTAMLVVKTRQVREVTTDSGQKKENWAFTPVQQSKLRTPELHPHGKSPKIKVDLPSGGFRSGGFCFIIINNKLNSVKRKMKETART